MKKTVGFAPISKAMAQAIARAWSGGWPHDGRFNINDRPNGYETPTHKALLDRGLIAPVGERGTFPNGDSYSVHRITPAALVALRDYLTKEIDRGAA